MMLKTLLAYCAVIGAVSQAQARGRVSLNDEINRGSVGQMLTDVRSLRAQGEQDIVVQLESGGGDLIVALDAFRELRQYGVTTSVTGDCSSACTVLFAAGQRRLASQSATFLFHGLGMSIQSVPASSAGSIASSTSGDAQDMRHAITEEQRGLTRDELAGSFANQWLSAVAYASPSLASELERNGTLIHGEREYTGGELRRYGYVTN